ncbi:membrane-bound lytic murein transglycosylase A [Nitrosomonas aestuarii]|uniref:peptidoglycan lytic exotransglycosylase n=1 Tax=Nitrosomonas aestuarii TaxID=52441 RepID=A0A1I4BKP6_9PROT|nr:murein transglycosylase A [Nitrosomonas aestuarii]SFK69394.1 membrane-bound lytic murein transglycosylase A [Nitrosomonas aestuarii]
MKYQSCFSIILLLTLLAACSRETTAPPEAIEQSAKPEVSVQEEPQRISIHVPAQWSDLTGWLEDDLRPAWQAFQQSCHALKKQPLWQEICAAALVEPADNGNLRNFFENNFTPYQIISSDGGKEGLVTGYYEPLLHGSRQPSERYRFPLYAAPDELLVIDFGALYPELKDLRLRGRLDGRKVVPYYSRAEIMDNPAILNGYELLWVDDEVELFFLQIQGSGRIQLDTGEIVKIGFADQNGYPYNSIGRVLVQQGELSLDKASMQGIKQWGQQNPDKLPALLQQNARYVFFRELPSDLTGPIGALGVPLTAGRSIAIDPRSIPQGAPVFLATTWPNSSKPLNRLMVAQDTGGAIKGGIRADFFWGYGPEAANQAGKMKQQGKMWVLMPLGYTAPQLAQQ